jgi:hypothetical protein
VTKVVYPTDDFLLSEQAGMEIQEFLIAHPDAIVIITRQDYEYLQGKILPDEASDYFSIYPVTSFKRILSWLSSTHYQSVSIEAIEKAKRWKLTVGDYLIDQYVIEEKFNGLIILAAKKS